MVGVVVDRADSVGGNRFGVPDSLAAARSRLPTSNALALQLAPSGPATDARSSVPTAGQVGGVDWVVADCVLWTWSTEALAELAAVLRATGDNSGGVRLAFVEPTAGLGLRHRAQLVAGPWLARRGGHRHHRDVPQELRDAGLVVTTAVRFTDGLGHYVWGEAKHYRHAITTR